MYDVSVRADISVLDRRGIKKVVPVFLNPRIPEKTNSNLLEFTLDLLRFTLTLLASL